MSGKLRHEVEKMRVKYARAFSVPIDDVEICWLDDDNAWVGSGQHPRWTYGPTCPAPPEPKR